MKRQNSEMPSPLASAIFVFVFFALLALHAYTDFLLYLVEGHVPRAVKPIDWLIRNLFVQPFGRAGAAIVLTAIGFTLALLILRRKPSRSPQTHQTDSASPKSESGRKAPSKSQPSGTTFVPPPYVASTPTMQQTASTRVDQDLEETEIYDWIEHIYNGQYEERAAAGRLPAWAILLSSPFDTSIAVSSWFGGLPHAPPGFIWPLDDAGVAIPFLAQIDLASIEAEPSTGLRPPGLPNAGALLIFAGISYACCLLTPQEVSIARAVPLPASAQSLREYRFYIDDKTFPCWPIRFEPYLCKLEESYQIQRPATWSDIFAKPETWLTNWGLAALEAEVVLNCLALEMGQAQWHKEYWERQEDLGTTLEDTPTMRSKAKYYFHILSDGPRLIEALTAWKEMASTFPPESRIDTASLADILKQRRAFADKIVDPYAAKLILPGNPSKVWEKLLTLFAQPNERSDFAKIPAHYAAFVTAKVTGWRNHRLFGIEPPFTNNGDDLSGQDCLISISADALLGTQSEHEYGFSIWCRKNDLAMGNYNKGELITHCAV